MMTQAESLFIDFASFTRLHLQCLNNPSILTGPDTRL